MSEIHTVPVNGGAAFFGFAGVSLALVLASITFNIQTSELLSELPKQALGSAAFQFGGPESS